MGNDYAPLMFLKYLILGLVPGGERNELLRQRWNSLSFSPPDISTNFSISEMINNDVINKDK